MVVRGDKPRDLASGLSQGDKPWNSYFIPPLISLHLAHSLIFHTNACVFWQGVVQDVSLHFVKSNMLASSKAPILECFMQKNKQEFVRTLLHLLKLLCTIKNSMKASV